MAMGPALKALKQKRHRLFAQNMGIMRAKGDRYSQKQAYIDAGYAPASADVGACNLLKNPKIIAAIREIEDEIYDVDVMSAKEMHNRLSRMGRVDPMEFTDDEGHIDISALRESGMIIAGIEVEETELSLDGGTDDDKVIIKRKIKIKGEGKAAMDSLAKLKGYNTPEEKNLTLKGDPDNPLVVSPQQAYEDLIKGN